MHSSVTRVEQRSVLMSTTYAQALFLVDEQNRAFVQERTGKIYSPVEDVKSFILLLALLTLTLLFLLIWHSWLWWQLSIGYSVALLLSWVGACYLPHYYRKRINTILTQGQVVIGYVLTTVARAEESGYKVTFTYEFTAPTGELLQGNRTEIRNDLKLKGLPTASTPVAVLYLNEKDFFLL
jgi:hypothetical protein